MQIVKKDVMITLGPPTSTKRENIYNKKNIWIDRKPREVIDLGTKEATLIFKLEIHKLHRKKARKQSVSHASTEGGTILDQPTQYKSKAEAKNARKTELLKLQPEEKRRAPYQVSSRANPNLFFPFFSRPSPSL